MISILAAMAAGLAGCGGEAAPEVAAPTAVQAVRVSAARPSAEVQASGRIARRREMELSFRVAGVMTGLSVDAGDRIAAGQVLANLDPTGLAAAEQRASAELERARRDYARDQALFEKGFVSRQRLDDRASAVKAAEAGHSAAAFDRRWTRLVSPVSGVVLQRVRQSGEVVQPGQTVLRVADEASPLVVRAPAPDRDAAHIRLGAPVRVRIDDATELPGRVSRIGESADVRTGAVEIEVELPTAPQLRSGQIATVWIPVQTQAAARPQAMARLPAEAILEAQGRQAAVLVVDPAGSTARRRAVTFGGFDGDDALVSGLPDGTQVITVGAGFVSDGEKVRVMDPARLTPQRTAAR
ncbi:efflux RND transporter periplasmic adaptor subunit [Phenylobacterium sp.]|uniref:efflux RND transporter periplasmic adaptor subunit n=1 Tax=Phenylobacterium sp. TaxID=1871053 RepID=UPI002E368E0B|nr:efflux RND transporter periplasmic adaptor subunit [Phenylobacterium sp.]HEX2559546.1 efflux RND transporter periplasmic adaptor subunit [Phenylobacterium sp.]